ncbi:MAG: hypothetical protein IPK82_08905 [Polyangiaceae bacterium]|nr:hypothetical protein [Polyangiaceae bacterium]
MVQDARFPSLSIPFFFVGGAAGWLSAGLIRQPFIYSEPEYTRLTAAALAAVGGAAIGFVLRRWYLRELNTLRALLVEDEAASLPVYAKNHWIRAACLTIPVGAIIAWVFTSLYPGEFDSDRSLPLGAIYSLPFIPVLVAVLSAASRSMRARNGSIVSGSDARSIWSILFTALSIATLEGLPDWPAPRGWPLYGPAPLVAMLLTATAIVSFVLIADIAALRKANNVIKQTELVSNDIALYTDDLNVVDLGLGQSFLAQIKKAPAAYRQYDRALKFIQGDPGTALGALRKAIRRGVWGLTAIGLVALCHWGASSDKALGYYEYLRCADGRTYSCEPAAVFGFGPGLANSEDRMETVRVYEKRCATDSPASCLLLASYYRGELGAPYDPALVALFEYRAAQKEMCPPGTSLIGGSEKLCVPPTDSRSVYFGK